VLIDSSDKQNRTFLRFAATEIKKTRARQAALRGIGFTENSLAT
jgi:hypothetical protein